MKISSLQFIEALGNLMCYYNSDLNYIAYFHNFKNSKITENEYLRNEKSCFQRFLNEYKVARNVKKNKVRKFMSFAKEWVLKKNSLDVDEFALALKKRKITQDGKIMTSLASKILFLNNPVAIIPTDTLNKRTLGEKSNIYSEFKTKIDLFISENKNTMEKYLNSVDSLLTEVEDNYKSIEIEFKKYRTMRFADKLLWTNGKR